jgi:predicted acylesterase/phospholipase RssA
VFEGCACRSSFFAGVAARLDEAGLTFPLSAGSSSGSLSAAAVAAGLASQLPALWRGLAGQSVFSWRRAWRNRSIFDMRTIVHNGIVDLLGDGDLRNAPGEAFAAVTLLPQFRSHFFSSRQQPDMIKILLGSCFIPGIYGPAISHVVDDKPRYLFDGGISNNLPIEAVIAAGATDIVCVVSRPRPLANKHPLRRRWQPSVPMGSTATIRIIYPQRALAVRSWDLNAAHVAAAIDDGRVEAERFLKLADQMS